MYSPVPSALVHRKPVVHAQQYPADVDSLKKKYSSARAV